MKRLSQTKAQKAYGVACDAARAWAASCNPSDLTNAAERIARSYGITPADAANIISKARIQRRV